MSHEELRAIIAAVVLDELRKTDPEILAQAVRESMYGKESK